MLHRTYADQECSIARALEAVGERWTLLIVRDALGGVRRFEQLQADLGIARNILSARLERLCAEGILERRRYRERPERFEYLLTQKGLDLQPVVLSLLAWGDRYASPEAGPPTIVTHDRCGHDLAPVVVCAACGEAVEPDSTTARPGPGRRPKDGTPA